MSGLGLHGGLVGKIRREEQSAIHPKSGELQSNTFPEIRADRSTQVAGQQHELLRFDDLSIVETTITDEIYEEERQSMSSSPELLEVLAGLKLSLVT